MAAFKELFVITHTQATHHLENKVGGWYDSDLTHRGSRQADAVAEHLAALIGSVEVEIYSSDLRRASRTAAAIAKRMGKVAHETPALREISYGVAGGKPQEWLNSHYTPAPDGNRLDHDCGIEGAETRRNVAARVFPFVDEIVGRPCQTQILVTHGFTLSMVVAAWMKIPICAAGFVSFPVKSGSVTRLRRDPYFHNQALISLGDVTHLSGV